MPTTLAWQDIAIRLAFTVGAGTLIGINRGDRARPAGLRTTLLVCVAASVAMLQANLLMATLGKTSGSFVTLDLMRLPLGILCGVGFIGAGTILRRGNKVVGVTTAATLWFVTVMGLCFGGGQIGLGLATLGLGLTVLWGFKWIENKCKQQRAAKFSLTIGAEGPTDEQIAGAVAAENYRIAATSVSYANSAEREINFSVHWRGYSSESNPPEFVKLLAGQPGIIRLVWKPLRANE
jgi:putative Mg2+ transporter-C (MgtC) family protein